MSLTVEPRNQIRYVPEGDGWSVTVVAREEDEEWVFNACVADRGQSEPTWPAIEADLRALAGDEYMRGIEELRENEQPPLRTLTHPTIWVLGARQWGVTFVGPLSDAARVALADAGVLLTGGWSGPGVESHSVRVEAVGARDAIDRVQRSVQQCGPFARWQAHLVADEHRL